MMNFLGRFNFLASDYSMPLAAAFALLIVPATGQCDVIRQGAGDDFLVVQAEDFDTLEGDEFTGFLPVDTETELETDWGSLVLPADSNVYGAALFDQLGNSDFVDLASYQLEFSEPGIYTVYLHYSMYQMSGEDTNYGNEDSFYFPLDLGEEPEQAGWFSLPKQGHDDPAEDPPFWEGHFNWAGPINYQESGLPIEYEVRDDDVGSALDFTISTRENGSTLDAMVFHLDPFLLPEDLDDIMENAGGPTVPGDFNGNEVLDEGDLNLLAAEIRSPTGADAFDLDGDGSVTLADQNFWVRDLKNTWIGDANLDGEFNSADFVEVFTRGEYEDDIDGNSTWADGDWDASGDFDSGDFVVAFSDGGFENGPRAAVASVPEPATLSLLAMGLWVFGAWRRRAEVGF